MPALTLERLVSSLGFGSRKESRSLIRMGLVEINGIVHDDPFMKLEARPEFINVNSEKIPTFEDLYLMMHKPVGVECSHNPRYYEGVFSLLPSRFLGMKIRSVGRLDVDSSGLLLFSNKGDFIHHIESPKRGVLKRYEVALARPLEEGQEKHLLAGVMLNNEKKPVFARSFKKLEDKLVEIEIGEGLYHQVRRMIAAVGNHAEALRRLSIGGVSLDPNLKPKEWRYLNAEEIESLSN
ncbi:MAG TPA: 16S rRNA pseudouridine(516) synthase [Fibrobacter sp.]|nr:16S rRNA pseudouridine(516) synthase [Fibrobacter sp.]